MPPLPRRLAAATTCALALSAAGPALARAATPHADPARASTALTQKIEYETRGGDVGIDYEQQGGRPTANQFTGRAADAASGAIVAVNRTPVDSAQLPAKLEWLVGVNLQVDGDNRLVEGTRALVRHHDTADARLRDGQAESDYRLSNYLIGQADTTLGIRHPTLSARPGRLYRDRPYPSAAAVTPTIPVTTRLSLTETIQMATPVIAETIPAHLYLYEEYGLLGPEQTACEYYALIVGRLPANGGQNAARRKWVTGVEAQRAGNRMLFEGLYHREGSRAADQREAAAGLEALRRGNALIAAADTALGIRTSGPSARLPRTFVLG